VANIVLAKRTWRKEERALPGGMRLRRHRIKSWGPLFRTTDSVRLSAQEQAPDTDRMLTFEGKAAREAQGKLSNERRRR